MVSEAGSNPLKALVESSTPLKHSFSINSILPETVIPTLIHYPSKDDAEDIDMTAEESENDEDLDVTGSTSVLPDDLELDSLEEKSRRRKKRRRK